MTTARFSPALNLALLSLLLLRFGSIAAFADAKAVDEAWRKAILANDLNGLVDLYATDAVMWLPDAPEARGREAIRKSYADMLAANTVTAATFANTHYETSGDLSVGWGDFKLTLVPRDGGSPLSLSGRFSVIAKKERGKWVYIVDHASAVPALKPR